MCMRLIIKCLSFLRSRFNTIKYSIVTCKKERNTHMNKFKLRFSDDFMTIVKMRKPCQYWLRGLLGKVKGRRA